MRFGSVCSGIEAASVAWNPLGWKAQWLSEIEPFPCSLLAHHYPDTPNLGDMTKFNDWPTDDKHAIDKKRGGVSPMAVRRLIVEECEFLQGFPRSFTAVPNRGKPAADGPRYKALGNSWAVPNVRWIGSRIDAVMEVA